MLRISLTKTACLLPLLALCLSGCGLTQRVSEGTKSAFNAVFYKKINTLHLDFTAREALNTDARENHSLSEPVVVRIYQLKDRQTFDRWFTSSCWRRGIFCSPPISSPVAMW